MIMRSMILTLGLSSLLALNANAQCGAPLLGGVTPAAPAAPIFQFTPFIFGGLGNSVSSTANSISVSWNPCVDLVGGCGAICYTVQWAVKGSSNAFNAGVPVYTNSYIINKLTPATDYKIRVLAKGCDKKTYVIAQTGDDAATALGQPGTGGTIAGGLGTVYDLNVNGISDAYVRTGTALCSMGAFESNNTAKTATSIANGTTTTAAIENGIDQDWYVINHTGGFLNVGLLNMPQGNNYIVEVFNAAQTPVTLAPPVVPVSPATPVILPSGLGMYRPYFLGDPGTIFLSGTGKDFLANSAVAVPAGKYYVKVSSIAGYSGMRCYALRTSSTAVPTSFGKAETVEIEAQRINAFPNPAHNFLTVALPSVETEMEATVRLSDIAGREILRTVTNLTSAASQVELDVNHIANGMYMVFVQYGTTTLTKKIVVAHGE
jgi:Secretion system C-terminal sorting domain/Fibronectin type III domain